MNILRVPPIGREEFHERFVSNEVPVIIEGGARDFPAAGRWTPEYLKKTMGAVPIRYKLSTRASHPDFHETTLGRMFARGECRFDEFIDFITAGPEAERPLRLFTGDEQFILQRRDGKTTLNADLAPLWSDVRVPPLFPEEKLYTVWGWFSGAGVRTWLHYDNNDCHNLNAQLAGEKYCRLYAASDWDKLHPFPRDGTNPAHNCSQIDVDEPDDLRFPAFREVPFWEGTLEAGDMLFIPALWPHTFSHRGAFNANVNFWWKP